MRDSAARQGGSVVYDPLSRRTSVTYGNGASMAYTYFPPGALQTLNHNMSGSGDDPQYTFTYTAAHGEGNAWEQNPSLRSIWGPAVNGAWKNVQRQIIHSAGPADFKQGGCPSAAQLRPWHLLWGSSVAMMVGKPLEITVDAISGLAWLYLSAKNIDIVINLLRLGESIRSYILFGAFPVVAFVISTATLWWLQRGGRGQISIWLGVLSLVLALFCLLIENASRAG